MASTATTSSTMTVTRDVSPAMTGAALSALLALPIEQLTTKQLNTIRDAISRVPRGGDPGVTVYDLLK